METNAQPVNRIFDGELPAEQTQTEQIVQNESASVQSNEQATQAAPSQAAPAEQAAATPPASAEPVQPVTPPTQAEPFDPYEALGLPKGGGEYKKFFEAAKAGKEEFKKFVDVAFTDYDKVSDQDVLRASFDKKYAGMGFTEDDRKLLFDDYVQKTYSLTGDEVADRLGLLRMKADALEVRNALKQEQAGYVIPTIGEQNKPQSTTQSAEYQELTEQLLNHPTLKQFETNRTVTFGSGEEAYNFEVSADVPVNDVITKNMGLLFQPFISKDANGKVNVDVARIAKLTAYAHNMDKVEEMLMRHGAKLGEKRFIDKELKNKVDDNASQDPPVVHKNRIF